MWVELKDLKGKQWWYRGGTDGIDKELGRTKAEYDESDRGVKRRA